MKLCLDTCAYSRLCLQPESLVICIDEAETIYLPCVVLGELFAGFCQGKFDSENRISLRNFIDLPSVEIIDIDQAIADRYGSLVKQLRIQGTPIPTNDIWIAAATFETGSHLVTYDSHFKQVPGLLILSP
jgi:predicted nucleic acid-binding protein